MNLSSAAFTSTFFISSFTFLDHYVAISALVLILLTSLVPLHFGIRQVLYKRRQNYQAVGHYQDQDGTATAESERLFSDLIPRTLLLIFSFLGTAASLTLLVGALTGVLCLTWGAEGSCQKHDESIWITQCFVLPSWVILFLQACIIFRTRQPTEKYRLGLFGALSSGLLAISFAVSLARRSHQMRLIELSKVYLLLWLIQLALALVLTFNFLLLPRRPDLYLNGRLVDRQHTVTALSKLTFSWVTPILYMTSKKKNIGYEDLPVISHELRAETLRSKFEEVGKVDKFWKTLFWAHWKTLATQWATQLVQSFLQFLPQIALYFTLKALEARDAGNGNPLQLWLLVSAIGFSSVAFTWVESWFFYICYVQLGAPIYEQISTVVFSKATRKKDVKGVIDTPVAEVENGSGQLKADLDHKGEDSGDDEGTDQEAAKTKQSTINLIGVDGKRIADFATYNSMIFGASAKLIIAITFLIRLVGFGPTLSGIGTFALLVPVNWWITKNYTNAQDALMKSRDQKLAIVTEALQGIRQIKFSALEKDWYQKILKFRKKELSAQWRAFCFDTALDSVWMLGPLTLSGVCLTVYVLINKELSASVAFTAISVFGSLEVTLAVIPALITDLFDALVSSRRIQEYLDSPDRADELKQGETISFDNATVAWPSDEKAIEVNTERFQLRNLDLSFPNGELSVISGRTGSGKSLLLSSIIGESDILGGQVVVPQAPRLSDRFDANANKNDWIISEAIAYVAQIPWIENATIKANIVFGLPVDDERYADVVRAAALEKDLEMLQDGDLTDIGANGINLSGGQKWRVSFARALYSRAGILVLDDIFSAVDAHVGKHLFEKALTGQLGRGRTRILVTHHVALCLPKTVYSVLLEDGSVVHAGLTEELRRNGLLKDILEIETQEQQAEDNYAEADGTKMIDEEVSLQKMLSNRSDRTCQLTKTSSPNGTLARRASHVPDQRTHPEAPKKFTEEERRETGAIKWTIYTAYIKACGGFGYWSFIVLIFTIWTAIYLGKYHWLSVWTRAYDTESSAVVSLFSQPARQFHAFREELSLVRVDHSIYYYVGIYLAFSTGQWIIGTLKYFSVYVASIRASKKLFEDLAHAILRAPLRFLDTTPVGRIVNRFTADFNNADSKVAADLMYMMHCAASVVASVVAGVLVSPIMLVFAAILFAACLWYAFRYLSGAREVKRLESNAKSPVFEQFGSVLTGIGTIRAFGKADEYVQRMEEKINTHCQAYVHLWLFNRWMSLRVSWIGAAFSTAMAALIVGLKGIDAPLAGFALSFSLEFSEYVIWLLRQYANLELDFNAVERIVEYSKMPTETQLGLDAPAAWPTRGEIEVKDLVVAYAPDLPPVLRGLTFNVRQHERIGVVGRTGAGKSSLTLALFRFLEARSGSVHIDGIDTSKIKLFDLRSRLAIIPQDPVLFSGTIRSNLDPFDQHTDSELREALTRVHLVPSASAFTSGIVTPNDSHNSSSSITSSTLGNSVANINVFSSLNSKISEGGLNLSQGQRQLLCLARAIVSRPKILLLDEATSSVDMETDALIQRSIREEFAGATLMVIAHRISTIADFDRILVLGDGKVIEYDKPESLMAKENSAFKEMVESSGERRELEAVIRAEKQG